MHKFWIIVGQVYKKNVKSVGFLTMMLAPLIMLAIVAVIIFFVSKIAQEIPTIAVISDSTAIRETLQTENDYFAVDPAILTKTEAEETMKNDELDGYLLISDQEGMIQAEYIHFSDSETLDMNYLSNLLTTVQLNEQAKELGVSQAEINKLLTPPHIAESTVSFEDGVAVEGNSADRELRTWTAYGICIAIFMFIMTYSGIIAEEIASEKGTRIMEVILSSVSATVHFFGKLVAIFLICLTQVAFYALIIAIAWQLDFVKQLIPADLDLIATLKGVVGISLYYFIMGIFLYAVIAAFLGSLVTKIEDVSKSVTPIVFIALIGFYGGLFSMASTTHPIIKVGSHIPLFTPFIMPFRIAQETVSTVEIGTSMVIMLIFTIVVTFISLLLYRSNVLIYSDSGMFKTIQTSFRNVRNEQRNLKQNA